MCRVTVLSPEWLEYGRMARMALERQKGRWAGSQVVLSLVYEGFVRWQKAS